MILRFNIPVLKEADQARGNCGAPFETVGH